MYCSSYDLLTTESQGYKDPDFRRVAWWTPVVTASTFYVFWTTIISSPLRLGAFVLTVVLPSATLVMTAHRYISAHRLAALRLTLPPAELHRATRSHSLMDPGQFGPSLGLLICLAILVNVEADTSRNRWLDMLAPVAKLGAVPLSLCVTLNLAVPLLTPWTSRVTFYDGPSGSGRSWKRVGHTNDRIDIWIRKVMDASTGTQKGVWELKTSYSPDSRRYRLEKAGRPLGAVLRIVL